MLVYCLFLLLKIRLWCIRLCMFHMAFVYVLLSSHTSNAIIDVAPMKMNTMLCIRLVSFNGINNSKQIVINNVDWQT